MKIAVNNITLHYTKQGAGAPLILLHGSGEDHHIFDKITDKLKQDFTVYGIDSRNHGESTKTNDFTYETMAEDICQFIQALKLEQVNAVGFSDGAIICLLIALRSNNPLKKMALLGANLKPTDFKKDMYDYLVKGYEKTKDPLFKMMMEQPNIELESLKNIDIPALVVAGQHDLFYRKTFTDITKTIPDATLNIVKGHDHDSYITNQDLLYPDLLEFFK